MKVIFTFCHDTENGETVFSGNVKVSDALRLLTNIVLTSFEVELANKNEQEVSDGKTDDGLDK